MNSAFQLLPAREYVKNATEQIKTAKHKVYVMSLMLVDDELTRELLEAAREAARRGLDVRVAGDYFTVTEHGGIFSYRSIKNRVTPARNLKKSFENAGASFTWLGRDSMSLYSGRTHTKFTVVDDTVYAFGGANLYKEGIESTDFMFKLTNPRLARQLAHELQRIINTSKNKHTYRSHAIDIPEGQVLIDGGFVGDSIIYRRACELVKHAKKVVYVSQYAPNGRLGRRLKKANAKLYFNPWSHPSDSSSQIFIRLSALVGGHKTRYKKPEYLHAKFIICTMPDGSKTAITGSHNFANGGMWLGTREIALETSDKSVIDQLESYFKQHIA